MTGGDNHWRAVRNNSERRSACDNLSADRHRNPHLLDGFRLDPARDRDVFSAAITKNVDVYITDVRDTRVRGRLPSWYFQLTDAGSFLLLPIHVDKRGFGLIYGEFATARQVELRTRTFNLVKSLRNQLILALRQQS